MNNEILEIYRRKDAKCLICNTEIETNAAGYNKTFEHIFTCPMLREMIQNSDQEWVTHFNTFENIFTRSKNPALINPNFVNTDIRNTNIETALETCHTTDVIMIRIFTFNAIPYLVVEDNWFTLLTNLICFSLKLVNRGRYFVSWQKEFQIFLNAIRFQIQNKQKGEIKFRILHKKYHLEKLKIKRLFMMQKLLAIEPKILKRNIKLELEKKMELYLEIRQSEKRIAEIELEIPDPESDSLPVSFCDRCSATIEVSKSLCAVDKRITLQDIGTPTANINPSTPNVDIKQDELHWQQREEKGLLQQADRRIEELEQQIEEMGLLLERPEVKKALAESSSDSVPIPAPVPPSRNNVPVTEALQNTNMVLRQELRETRTLDADLANIPSEEIVDAQEKMHSCRGCCYIL